MALTNSLEIKRDRAAQSTKHPIDSSIVVAMPRMLLVVLVGIVVLIVQIDQLVFVEQTVFFVVLEIVVIELCVVFTNFLKLVSVTRREIEITLVTSIGR
jgi:hypothetical protein